MVDNISASVNVRCDSCLSEVTVFRALNVTSDASESKKGLYYLMM